MLLLVDDIPGMTAAPDRGVTEPLPISAVASPDNERMVRAYLAALVGDHHWVDDLSQEVFLRALERLHLLADPEVTRRVLRGIARRVAHEHFRFRRRSRRYVTATLDQLAAEDFSLAETLHHRESVSLLQSAILDLPLISRRMLELRYHDGLTASDIAGQLGLQAVAVRVTLLRIRERLHRRLAARL